MVIVISPVRVFNTKSINMQGRQVSIPKVSIEQIKAARALLRWSQIDLAEKSGVSIATIKRLEAAKGDLAGRAGTSDAIRAALESAGVEFIAENSGGAGVRLRKPGGNT